MKMFAMTVALLLAASPVAAQQQRQQALGAGGQVNNSTLPNTGLICIEEMVATFCNLPVGPNLAGYGSTTTYSGRAPRPRRGALGLHRAPGPRVTGGPSQAVVRAPPPPSTLAGRSRRPTNCATERTMKQVPRVRGSGGGGRSWLRSMR